jgi:hypothetical protein
VCSESSVSKKARGGRVWSVERVRISDETVPEVVEVEGLV